MFVLPHGYRTVLYCRFDVLLWGVWTCMQQDANSLILTVKQVTVPCV